MYEFVCASPSPTVVLVLVISSQQTRWGACEGILKDLEGAREETFPPKFLFAAFSRSLRAPDSIWNSPCRAELAMHAAAAQPPGQVQATEKARPGF